MSERNEKQINTQERYRNIKANGAIGFRGSLEAFRRAFRDPTARVFLKFTAGGMLQFCLGLGFIKAMSTIGMSGEIVELDGTSAGAHLVVVTATGEVKKAEEAVKNTKITRFSHVNLRRGIPIQANVEEFGDVLEASMGDVQIQRVTNYQAPIRVRITRRESALPFEVDLRMILKQHGVSAMRRAVVDSTRIGIAPKGINADGAYGAPYPQDYRRYGERDIVLTLLGADPYRRNFMDGMMQNLVSIGLPPPLARAVKVAPALFQAGALEHMVAGGVHGADHIAFYPLSEHRGLAGVLENNVGKIEATIGFMEQGVLQIARNASVI
jgi:hypothetical protein